MDSLQFTLDLAGSYADRNPLDTTCLTLPQREFASMTDTVGLWRDGNQLGKSWGLAWDLHHRCRNTHPYQPTRRPGSFNALIASVSYEQMTPLMEKIWLLVPKNEIDPDNGFEPGRGITGKPPRIVYVAGPGKGSVINFATYAAGAKRIAGWTGDYLGMDEPPEEGFFGEALPRIMRRRGVIRICMTPTPDMPDQAWLRKKVAERTVREINFGLHVDNLVPEGFPAPWLSQAEIDEYADTLLEHERAMRIDGAWVALTVGRWLKNFDTANVGPVRMSDVRGWDLIVGMDHGTPAGKQCAVLAAVHGGDTPRPRVAFLDESVNSGLTTPENDAQGVLDMLARNGLTYDHVDRWIGDVPTESKMYGIRKSNAEIRRELARLLKRRVENTKFIDQPKKHGNSMTMGYRMLNTIFGRRSFGGRPDGMVSDRCTNFVHACWNFKGDTHDPVKDVLDGGRYAVERAVSPAMMPILSAAY